MGTATSLTLDMLKVMTPDKGLVSVGEGPWGEIYADYLKNAGNRNIVWKRRQLGMTTFSLARGFLKAAEGKTCIIVAHQFAGADYLWDMVETFIANLPAPLPIKWKNSQKRCFGLDGRFPAQFQIGHLMMAGFGLGMNVDFVHLQEFAWWPRRDQERVWQALAPCLKPDAEVIIESAPKEEDNGLFDEIWKGAPAYGFTRHFFPWWRDSRYVAEPVDPKSLKKAEKELIDDHGLTLEQIGWRRKQCDRFMELYGSEKMFKMEYSESVQ